MPVILDEVDFMSQWRDDRGVEDYLTMVKNQCTMAYPRNIQSRENNVIERPSCSYIIITHNSSPVDEDGFSKRFTPFVLTDADVKTKDRQRDYDRFFEENGADYAYFGDFAIDYIMHSPDVLRADWLTTGKKVLSEFYSYAGLCCPDWIDEIVENSSGEDIEEQRRTQVAAILLDMINRAWAQNRIELADKGIDGVTTEYDLTRKIMLLTEHHLLPDLRLHHEKGICILSSFCRSMERKGVDRVSHRQLAPLCGFEYLNLRFDSQQVKVVSAPLDKFVRFLTPKGDSLQTTLHGHEIKKAETV